MSEAVVSHITKQTSIEKMSLLGLNREVLSQTMSMGLSQYKSASKLEPLNAGGSKASFAIIETLRQQLLSNEKGWSMINHNGQCLTVNSSHGMSIIATSGDKYTGLSYDLQPCTKNGKGLETKSQIERNQGQTLCLFDEGLMIDRENSSPQVETSADGNELWVLLYYFDLAKKEVRFELSLPIGIKEVGSKGKVKVSEWADRIIFTPLPFEQGNDSLKSPDFNDEIEFNIKQKE